MARQGSEEAYERRLRAVGMAVSILERMADRDEQQDIRLKDIRLQLDADNDTCVLGVLKGTREGKKYVSFVGGLSLSTTLLTMAKKLRAAALRWRDDRPWTP